MTFIRTAVFYLIAGVTVALWTVPVIVAALFPYHRVRWPLARSWGRLMMWTLRVVCGVRYTVDGAQHFPSVPSVVYCKHQSAWETIAMIAVCPAHTWVLKRELMWVPFLGWALAAMRPAAIDRSSGRTAVRQVVDQGRRALASGQWLMVFPEGTRVPVRSTRRYGISGAVLATETGAPLVPIAHDGGHVWPRQGLIRPGLVRVVIGPPIVTVGRAPNHVNDEAKAWIDAAMERLEGPSTVQ